jgi:hypothetical protein
MREQRQERRSANPSASWFRSRDFRRVVALVGCAGLSLFYAVPATASNVHRPTITPTQASFTVPAGKTTLTWTLRLWSHGNLEGSSNAMSGLLVVSVPHQSDCTFQADVSDTAPGGSPQYYSGNRVTLTSCGPPPPTQTIAGHIYLCSPGGLRTTTEVAGGTLSATGPQTVTAQANPLSPATVAAGTYLMAAGTPTGFLFVDCGGAATPAPDGLTASESLFIPSGATEVGLFYVSAPPVAAGGGTGPSSGAVPATPEGSTGPTTLVPPAAIASGQSALAKVVPVAASQLAFTGMNIGTPLLLGLVLFAVGLLLVAVARIRRSTGVLLVLTESTTDA